MGPRTAYSMLVTLGLMLAILRHGSLCFPLVLLSLLCEGATVLKCCLVLLFVDMLLLFVNMLMLFFDIFLLGNLLQECE